MTALTDKLWGTRTFTEGASLQVREADFFADEVLLRCQVLITSPAYPPQKPRKVPLRVEPKSYFGRQSSAPIFAFRH